MNSIIQDIQAFGLIIIFIKTLLFLTLSYFIGLLFIKDYKDDLTNFLLSTVVGLIIISVFSALFKYGITSQIIPLLAIPIYQFYYKRVNQINLLKIPIISRKSIVILMIVFSGIYLYNFFISIRVTEDSITFLFDDFYYYSDLIKLNWEEGVERTTKPIIVQDKLNHLPYHYFELWYSGFASNTLKINYSSWFLLGHKSIITLLLFISFYILAREFRLNYFYLFLFLFVPFLTSLPDITTYFDLPWYLQLNYRNLSIINHVGAQPLILFLIISFLLLIKNDFEIGLIFFSLTSIINPLLIGIIPLTFILTITNSFIFQKGFWALHKKIIYRGFCLSILITLYTMIVCSSAKVINLNELFSFSNIATSFVVFCKIIIAFFIYFAIYTFSLFHNKAKNKVQPFFLELSLIFLFSSIIFFSFFYDSVGGNLNQILFVVFNFPLIIFGWLFLLKEVSLSERILSKFLLVICLLNVTFGVWNTYSEFSSSFGPLYWWNKNQGHKVSINDATNLNLFFKNKTTKIGYIINNDSYSRGVNISDLSYLSSINQNIESFRMHSVKDDFSNIRMLNNLKQSIYFSAINSNKVKEIKQIAKKLDIEWIYVDNKRFIIPDTIKKQSERIIKFQGFSLYKTTF